MKHTLQKLSLQKEDKKFISFMSCIKIDSISEFGCLSEAYFCNDEINEYDNLKFDRRKRDYILGRISSKIAIGKYAHSERLNRICLANGYFQQPIIISDCCKNVQVSVSHCDNYGIAIAYDEKVMMGIDLEKIRYTNTDTINSQLTLKEKKIIDNLQKEHLFTVMWTMKEALSKALRIGYLSPLSVFEIDEIIARDNNDYIYVGSFSKFPQFNVIAHVFNGFVLTIVYPIRLNIDYDYMKLIDFFD